MPSVVILILLALAVAEVTWLVVDAAITTPVRRWVTNRFGVEGKLTYLVHCPGCTAVWVSVPLTGITFATQHLAWVAFLAVLAMAKLAPMVLSASDRLEIRGS
jgi:hypothetical protein